MGFARICRFPFFLLPSSMILLHHSHSPLNEKCIRTILWMAFKIPDWRSSKARTLFDPFQLCLIGPCDLTASTNSNTYSTHAKWRFWKDLTIHQPFSEISSVKVTRQFLTISGRRNFSFHFCPETPTMGFPSKVSCFNLIKCQFTGSKQDTIKVLELSRHKHSNAFFKSGLLKFDKLSIHGKQASHNTTFQTFSES